MWKGFHVIQKMDGNRKWLDRWKVALVFFFVSINISVVASFVVRPSEDVLEWSSGAFI